jgi:hypothetical protein
VPIDSPVQQADIVAIDARVNPIILDFVNPIGAIRGAVNETPSCGAIQAGGRFAAALSLLVILRAIPPSLCGAGRQVGRSPALDR